MSDPCKRPRIEQASPEDQALKLIEALKERGIDYTMTLWLQLPDADVERIEPLQYIRELAREMEIPIFDHGKRYRIFQTVDRYIVDNGVQLLPGSKNYIDARKKDVLKRYLKERKSLPPHMPFLYQTCIIDDEGEFKDTLFHLYTSWQHGLVVLLEMLKRGDVVHNSKLYRVKFAFEHVIDRNSICYLLCDWELSSAYRDASDIAKSMDHFISLIHSRMLGHSFLNEEDPLAVTVKNKTRPMPPYIKVSSHFILNIAAPRSKHAEVMDICCQEETSILNKIKEYMKKNKKQPLPQDFIFPPEDPVSILLPYDIVAGRMNGFATYGSKKREEDPFSSLQCDQVYYLGIRKDEYPCTTKLQHDLHGIHITDKERLDLMRRMCYTVPKIGTICYNQDEDLKKEVCPHRDLNPYTPKEVTPFWWGQKRVLPRGPDHPLEQPVVQTSQQPLPGWLMSVLSVISNQSITVNEAMPCISKMEKNLPDIPIKKVYRVYPSFCPKALTETGDLTIPGRNGVFVAPHGNAALFTGVSRQFKIEKSNGEYKVVNTVSSVSEDGIIEGVNEISTRYIHWLMLTQEELYLLAEKGNIYICYIYSS